MDIRQWLIRNMSNAAEFRLTNREYDAHEFMFILLEGIQTQLHGAILHQWFEICGIAITEEYTCDSVGRHHEPKATETHFCLSLALKNKNTSTELDSLEVALEEYVAPYRIPKKCQQCHCDHAFQQAVIKSFPQVRYTSCSGNLTIY